MCAVCVCLSLPISFGCCCSSWLILSFLLLFFLFLSGGPVLKIHLTNPPYSKCKKGKPTKGIRRAKKKIKKKYHNKTKTQPFSVSEGIHFFSSPDDIHTQEKKKDDIIIIVGFLKEINRKPSPSHRAFAQQQQQHPFYSFQSPWTQHTYRHRLENVFFF